MHKLPRLVRRVSQFARKALGPFSAPHSVLARAFATALPRPHVQQHHYGNSLAGTRVAVVGAGSVGATSSYACLLQKVCGELILVDSNQALAKGQVLDLMDAQFMTSTQVKVGSLKEAGQADVIIVTAGAKQEHGESRMELIERNYLVMQNVISGMMPLNPGAVIIVVANPVDILTSIAQHISGLPKNQVVGSGTFLDSARLRVRLAQTLDISETAIHAYVLGEHGDSQFIAWSSANVGGKPLLSFPSIARLDLDEIADQVAHKAYDIIDLKGSTYFGIGACVASLAQSVLFNQRNVRPVTCHVERYGVCLSMPAVIGSRGVHEVLQVTFDKREEERFLRSVEAMRDAYRRLGI